MRFRPDLTGRKGTGRAAAWPPRIRKFLSKIAMEVRGFAIEVASFLVTGGTPVLLSQPGGLGTGKAVGKAIAIRGTASQFD